MMKVFLAVALLAAAVFAESARETETWVPSKAAELNDGNLEASGDFDFINEDLTTVDDDDEDEDLEPEDYNFDYSSGSGDDDYDLEENFVTATEMNNFIPDVVPSRPGIRPVDDMDLVEKNEVARSFVQQNKTENIFNKTEVLAAVIAGGAVGLLFAVLLILLLVYRMKKKDEGSYDLGKKPIYKKAPTAEIYA